MLDFRPQAEKPPTWRLDFDSCTSRLPLARPGGIEILTLNHRLPPHTATPSPNDTPTQTPPATYTATPSPTVPASTVIR
jgi:hypothetical protein